MGRIRNTLVAAAIGAAVAAQGAAAQDAPDPTPPPIVAPPSPPPAPPASPSDRGDKGSKSKPAKGGAKPKPDPGKTGGTDPAQKGQPLPAPASCGPISVPVFLIPIYQQASQVYGLGPAGPSILAAINEIETGFGVNQGPSSAGAVGWMQFMPATWAAYGVDANGDGRKDPADPEDAIHAAGRYLRAGGMPEDPERAIFAYNHADWYVADVLARAACYAGVGNGALGGLSLIPKRQQLLCTPAENDKPGEQSPDPQADQGGAVPEGFLAAFQEAAGRYDLGEEAVWALAAIARLESDYGRGMTAEELEARGPMGISDANWERFAVDGDGDGKVQRQSPGDSASTLARMIWASGSLRAGIFEHNHASWYIEEALQEAEPLAGKCRVRTVSYAIALPGPTSVPINWENLELSNSLELWDLQQGRIDPRVIALIAAISQDHKIRLSSLRSDHDMHTAGGNVSNHYFGRAVDIAAIDGVPCTVTTPESPCGTIAQALAQLPPGQMPTELIFCFDADGPGPAFAAADHCDHIHAGYES